MKRITLLLLLLVVALTAAWARQATEGAAATKEDVEKLFSTLHIRQQMQNVMELSAKQSARMAHDALKKKMPEVTQKDLDRVNAIVDRTLKRFDINGMIDDMVPVYQQHLTKADVSAMIAFYETPTGQKVLREQPAMMAEAMKAVQPRMEKMMNEIMDDADKMAKEATGTAPKPANTDKN
jgi:hypothetical protein